MRRDHAHKVATMLCCDTVENVKLRVETFGVDADTVDALSKCLDGHYINIKKFNALCKLRNWR